jgi:hypothetical protein
MLSARLCKNAFFTRLILGVKDHTNRKPVLQQVKNSLLIAVDA